MNTDQPMGAMSLDERAKIRGELMEKLVPRIKAPPVEAANTAHIVLDRHYDAGLTVPEWVSAVGQALNMETDGTEFGEQEPRTQPAPQPAAQPVSQHAPEPKPPGGAPPDADEEDDEPEDEEEDDKPLPSEARAPTPRNAAVRHAEAGHSAGKPLTSEARSAPTSEAHGAPTNSVRAPLTSDAHGKGKQRR
jgi:hypothetical protein